MRPARLHLSLLVALGLPLLLSLSGCGPPRGTAVRVVVPAPPWRGLPLRSRTSAGTPDDPINLGVEGARAAILAAFQKSGWVPADPLSPRNDARLALDVVLHRSYPRAPVSRLYLFGRPEDLAVEHELGAVSRRDHARFWDTHRRDPQTHLELWIGDASRDTGVEVALSHGIPVGTTHHISPFVDAERRRIVATLRRAGVVAAVVMEPDIGPTLLGHNGAGDPFVTDGRAAVIVLTQPYPPRVTPVRGRQVDVGERQPTESQGRRLEIWAAPLGSGGPRAGRSPRARPRLCDTGRPRPCDTGRM